MNFTKALTNEALDMIDWEIVDKIGKDFVDSYKNSSEWSDWYVIQIKMQLDEVKNINKIELVLNNKIEWVSEIIKKENLLMRQKILMNQSLKSQLKSQEKRMKKNQGCKKKKLEQLQKKCHKKQR